MASQSNRRKRARPSAVVADRQAGRGSPGVPQAATETATISPAKLAAYWSVHVHTIYRDIRKGALPAYRLPGGLIRIRLEDARRYGRPIE